MTETISCLPKISLTLVVTNTVAIETEHDTEQSLGSNPLIKILVDDNIIYTML